MEGCCSVECVETIHLPEEEQKIIRRGIKNGNKIFKKGKSDKLTFKNAEDVNAKIAVAEAPKPKTQNPTPKIKKTLIGNGIHFFPKANIGQF